MLYVGGSLPNNSAKLEKKSAELVCLEYKIAESNLIQGRKFKEENG